MAVDFNAEPSPEGMALAAQLRSERLERDKVLEDRIAEAQARELEAACLVHETFNSKPSALAPEDEIDEDEPAAPAQTEEAVDHRQPEGGTTLSLKAEVEALASTSRRRQVDRQR